MLPQIVFTLLLASLVISTPFYPCPGSRPAPDSVDIPGCNTDNCNFVKGQTYSFSVSDNSEVNTTTVTLQLNVYYPTKPTDTFNITEDGCTRLTNGNCPLTTAEPFTYSRNITLIPGNETEQVQTEFILYGDGQQVITCFRINNTAEGSSGRR